MKAAKLVLCIALMVIAAYASAFAQHTGDHERHMLELNERGDLAMGFSQARATHHFRLLEDGGNIEVSANDPQDAVSKDQIRQHLRDISRAFSEGDFGAPVKIHKQMPPGAPVMQEMRAAIAYRFEPTEAGGRVRISTSDKRALEAIHEFLRFQIKEHRTGDPLSVASR